MHPQRQLLTLLLLFAVAFCATARGGMFHRHSQFSQPDTINAVSILTCAPGEEVYELEGHTALRIRHHGSDYVVNWGLFDFNSPNFLYRFVKGETDYCAGIENTTFFIDRYLQEGRSVTEQILSLTPAQIDRVVDLVNNNLLPQNRTYRYNYIYDNCATRPIAIIEQAIGRNIEFTADSSVVDRPTFRKMMAHYHRLYPWYQFGIDLALGNGIDYVLRPEQEIFAPVRLAELLPSTGLIRQTATYTPPLHLEPIPATPWYLTPISICIILLLIAAIVTIYDVRNDRRSRGFDVALFSLYAIMGSIIAFLVFVSEHEATTPNFNLLWLNPMLFFVPICIYAKSLTKFLKYFLFLYCFCSLGYLCLYPIQAYNIAFIPMILTINIRAIFIFTK